MTRVINMATTDISPVQAQEMLDNYPYVRQRELKREVVAYYAKLMKKRAFGVGSDIEIGWAPDEDGEVRGFLINGQHRLHGVIAAGVTYNFVMKHWECDSLEELGWLYGRIDIQKRRSGADLGRALGLADALQLSDQQVGTLRAAVNFMDTGFKKGNKYLVDDSRSVQLQHDFADAMRQYLSYQLTGVPDLRQQLRRYAPVSLGLVTVTESMQVYGEAKIEAWWTGLALDDGLRHGDPRKVAVRHLFDCAQRVGSKINLSPEYTVRALANCFNAFMEDREIKNTRVPDRLGPFKINGSRYIKGGG